MRFHAVTKIPLYNLSMKRSYILSDQYTVFCRLFSTQNMFRGIEGKIISKWFEGEQKLLRVSGRFELVIEGSSYRG